MQYTERAPHPSLLRIVRCIWIFDSSADDGSPEMPMRETTNVRLDLGKCFVSDSYNTGCELVAIKQTWFALNRQRTISWGT